jgi:hypothetical protein
MSVSSADKIAALEARLSAITIALTEFVETVDGRMPGVKQEVAEAIHVNERGPGDVHAHPAGAAELRRLREALWTDWQKM